MREEVDERGTEDEEGERGERGHSAEDVLSGTRGEAHLVPVVQPDKRGHADAHSRAEAVVEEETERSDGEHHLEGGQRRGVNPACHDAAEGESTALHAHLQTDGE